MYTKLFEKILDSSIWLEPDSTLRLWITLLASMNEDGFCAFACEENLGRRARLKPSLLRRALETLSSPDTRSADSEHEGRRIEKVPGGWMVLNAKKYRALASRMDYIDSTRERVRRHREAENAGTTRNTLEHLGTPRSTSEHLGTPSDLTPLPSVSGNGPVTLSEADTEADISTATISDSLDIQTDQVWASYPSKRKNGVSGQISRADQEAIADAIVRDGFDLVIAGTRNYREATDKWQAGERQFIQSAYIFFGDGPKGKGYLNDPVIWQRQGKNAPPVPASLGLCPAERTRRSIAEFEARQKTAQGTGATQ